MTGIEMIKNALNSYIEKLKAQLISNSALRIKINNYEYVFNADEINYVGDGAEFLVAGLTDGGWTNHGATLSNGVLEIDGASYLSRENITLGGRDFQIRGKVFESASDMIQRRKIFELYTNDDLNMSLYSSGAGKNLDFFVNCDGTLDNYAEPAILEKEYEFTIVWRQDSMKLVLYVDDIEIYSNRITGFSTQRTFSQLYLGAGIYHSNSFWKGTISAFKIFDGYSEA